MEHQTGIANTNKRLESIYATENKNGFNFCAFLRCHMDAILKVCFYIYCIFT